MKNKAMFEIINMEKDDASLLNDNFIIHEN